MTIYAYCRTSELEDSMDQDRLNGILEPELLGIQTYCLQKGWYMTQTITETNCRWNQEFVDRERGKLLLEAMNPGDVLLCSRLERIASSSQEVQMLVNLFSQRQIALHVVELGGDITDPELTVSISRAVAIFAALEKRKSAERIKGVKQRQKQQGRYLGGSRPFGYMIHDNGRLIENPMEQKVLKRIFELKREGKSLRSISNEVSTPVMPISFKTVQRLLMRHADLL
ncbi:MAG: recombinase family protein [Pseudomonadota bacterium]|nr:recombinase family protein [Pseudomonadota bacterium]MEC8472473.1 recombinase family protein [Pseudomonadota bacterium]